MTNSPAALAAVTVALKGDSGPPDAFKGPAGGGWPTGLAASNLSGARDPTGKGARISVMLAPVIFPLAPIPPVAKPPEGGAPAAVLRGAALDEVAMDGVARGALDGPPVTVAMKVGLAPWEGPASSLVETVGASAFNAPSGGLFPGSGVMTAARIVAPFETI